MHKADDTYLPEDTLPETQVGDANGMEGDVVAQSVETLSALAVKARAGEAGKMLAPAQEVLPPLADVPGGANTEDAKPESATQQLTLDLEKNAENVYAQKAAQKNDGKAQGGKTDAEPTKVLSASAQPPAPAKRQRVGELLREARMRFGYTVDVIADELKVKRELVDAVENGDFTGFSSRTYAIGFVRNYAALVQMNVEDVLLRTRSEISSVLPQQVASFVPLEDIQPQSSLPSLSAIVSGLAVLLVVYALGYSFFRTTPQMEESPASLAAALPVAPAPAPAPVAAAPVPAAAPEAKIAVAPAAESNAQGNAAAGIATLGAQLAGQMGQTQVQENKQQAMPGAAAAQMAMQAGVAENPVNTGISAQAASAPQADERVTDETDSANVLPNLDGQDEVQKKAQVPAPTPTALASTVPSSVSVTPVPARASPDAPRRITSRIRLQATDSITVQIFDAKGHMLAERQIAKGEAFFVPDNADYTMATSNAGAMRVQVDGRELPPLGARDEAVHNIPLNADELLNAMN